LVRPQLRAKKHGPVLSHFAREVPEGHIWIDWGAVGAPVKICQNLGKAADILLAHASFLEADVKHAIRRKTLHLDGPVYDLPFASQGHRTWSGTGQGDNAPIDTGRKAAVQSRLLTTVSFAGPPRLKSQDKNSERVSSA
jgi:hypothetical protein